MLDAPATARSGSEKMQTSFANLQLKIQYLKTVSLKRYQAAPVLPASLICFQPPALIRILQLARKTTFQLRLMTAFLGPRILDFDVVTTFLFGNVRWCFLTKQYGAIAICSNGFNQPSCRYLDTIDATLETPLCFASHVYQESWAPDMAARISPPS